MSGGREPADGGGGGGGGDLARYYAARAAEYERIYDKPERQADLARLRASIPAYFAGRSVLEVACGTGYWTEHIARVAASITATDINPETLAVARAKNLPPDRVRFEVADAWRLPAHHGERAFTAAFAGFWWSHLRHDERRPFIAALHRALRPGAVVVILDNRFVAGSSTPIAHTDAAGNTFQLRQLAGGQEHLVLKNFPTEDALRADLEGLAHAPRYEALEYYWVLTYEVDK